MARRKDSLAAIFLQLPWWASLVAAAVVYLLAMTLGPRVLPESNQLAPAFANAARTAGTILAGFFVLLSIGSAVRALFSSRLLDEQSSIESIRSLSWRQFEVLVAEAFRRRDYTVLENGGGGADGGVDVVLLKGGQKFFVQCKRWRAQQVGVTTVRELKGVIATSGAAGGFVVSSGSFTAEAESFAASAGIELVDGRKLHRMLEEVRSDPADAPSKANRMSPPADKPAAPLCPRCGGSMVIRTARRGAHAGGQFWGCDSFPKCRGTVEA